MPPETDDISPYIRIRISTERKREWIEYLDESTYSTLTDLIKTSVNNTISGDWVLEKNHEDSSHSVPENISESLDEVTSRLEALEGQLDDAVLNENEPETIDQDELLRVAHLCHDVLPVVADGEQMREMLVRRMTTEPIERPKITGTAHDISVHIDEPTQVVRQALIYLEHEDTTDIHSIVHEGVRHWYEQDSTISRDVSKFDEPKEEVADSLGFETATELEDQ